MILLEAGSISENKSELHQFYPAFSIFNRFRASLCYEIRRQNTSKNTAYLMTSRCKALEPVAKNYSGGITRPAYKNSLVKLSSHRY